MVCFAAPVGRRRIYRIPRHHTIGDPAIRTRALLVLSFLAVAVGLAVFLLPRPAENGIGDEAREAADSATPQRHRTVARDARSVLLVTLDTTRPDHLQPYGADDVATPVLQQLADRGVLFEQAWSVAPITLVAHTSILSGLYPFEHGVRNNGTQYVSEEITTLPEILGEAGYRTAAFVSAAVLERRYGLGQGFGSYDDDLSNRRNLSPRMVADRPAEATVDAATAWLDQLDDDERFFTWVHFYDPHAGYSPPAPYRDDYRERLYDGEIAYMDAQLGRLLQHPRLLGADSDKAPIVLVIGDHGESLGEHGERTHAILAYDSTLHVPWIAYIPGGPSGLRVSQPVGQVDLAPTVLSLLGMKEEDGLPKMSGRDLTPILEGDAPNINHAYYSETYLPFYTYGWAKLKVLHKGRWKFIDAPTPELYDRGRDPLELTDLHARHTDIAHDMRRDLEEWLADHDVDREAGLPLDEEALDKLRSLGYLSVGSGSRDAIPDDQRPNPMEMIEQHVGLENARALLGDRLYDQAAKRLESVLRSDPQNLAALLDLVRAEEGRGDIDKAVRLAERALELDPEYLQTIMTLARLEAQRDNLDHAVELLDFGAEKDPKNPDLGILKATFLQRLGRPDEVEATLRRVLENHPEHPRANAVYAHLVEAREGDFEAAEERLHKAVTWDPFIDQAWLFLGRVQERRGKPQEAETSYRRGLQNSPDDSELHGALGHLLARLGRPVDAVAQLREAIRLSSQPRTELHVSLGAVLAEMGRFEEAQREYDKVLAMHPKHPGARNNAAVALYQSGRLDEARALLLKIVEDHPRHADAHNNLAAIAVDLEKWDEAVEHSRRTLELAPGLVEAWNNLAIGLDETGRTDEALEAYAKALEPAPDYWQARYNLGVLLKKLGRVAEAAEAFELVLEAIPNHGETHLELGELYAGPLADPDRARTHWNAFLRHAAGHPRTDEIRRRLARL